MSKNSSDKHYQENKERLQTTKKAYERYQNQFKNRDNMGMNIIKIYLKMKNKSWLNIEKYTIK